MTLPLAGAAALGREGALIAALIIGIAFGWTLERAGLGSARKLMGQFTLRDFTVFKVMFSAIVTAMLGTFWLAQLGWLDLSRVAVPDTFLLPQLAGGVIFGAGFVAAGLCPGTSCVAAASGRVDGLMVVGGLLAGVTVTGLSMPGLMGFYDATPRGPLTLPDVLHISYGAAVFVVVLLALAGFQIAGDIERRQR